MVKKYLETLYGMGEKALQALIIIVIGYVVYKIFDKLFTKFIEKQGKRKSLIFANISIVLSISILIFAQNIWYVFAFRDEYLFECGME